MQLMMPMKQDMQTFKKESEVFDAQSQQRKQWQTLTVYKDIFEYIKNPAPMTTNEVNGKAMFQFGRVLSQLEELKKLFEEKANPSSSKGGNQR